MPYDCDDDDVDNIEMLGPDIEEANHDSISSDEEFFAAEDSTTSCAFDFESGYPSDWYPGHPLDSHIPEPSDGEPVQEVETKVTGTSNANAEGGDGVMREITNMKEFTLSLDIH